MTDPVRQALGMQKAQTCYYDSYLGVVWKGEPREAGPCRRNLHTHQIPRLSANGKDLVIRFVKLPTPQKPGEYEKLLAALTPPVPRPLVRK